MSRKITVHKGLQEAELFGIDKTLMQSGEERLHETIELILRVYGLSRVALNKRQTGKRIKISDTI
jgi:hypothetical protein